MIKDKWWTAAVNIKEKDFIEISSNKYEEILEVKIKNRDYPIITYNITVEDNHTYYTGYSNILTHNMAGKNPCFNDAIKNNKLLSTEGNVGSYKYLRNRGKIGDNITPHHIPSKEYMKKYDVKINDGVSINMEQPTPGKGGRHRLTKTYGRNMSDVEKQAYYNLNPRDALVFDIKDLRKIYMEQELYTPEIRKGLIEAIKLNKKLYPNIFNK